MKTNQQKKTVAHPLGVVPARRPGRPRKTVKAAVAEEIQQPVQAPAPEEKKAHADVRQRAMLVKLEIHRWPAKATDEDITDDVAAQHGIAREMGAYTKQLLPKSALEKLRAAGSRLRARHNRLTLPWDEWSTRILSSKAFFEYQKVMRPGIDEIDQIFRDELEATDAATGLTKYQMAKDEAKLLLNGAYREADYPSLNALRNKFRAKLTVMPIPDSADFRIDLGAEVTAQVRSEIEGRVHDQLAEAMQGLYQRVHGVVAKLAEALKGEKTEEIRHTLFMAINNVLEVLPLLNVTGDPNLDVIAGEISAMVQGLTVRGLKESEPLRTQVIEQADAILAKMNDFLG